MTAAKSKGSKSSKRSKTQKPQQHPAASSGATSYAGIPANERDNVHLHMHMLAARVGIGFECTPQQAYADLLRCRKREAEKKAEKKQQTQAESAGNAKDYALKHIPRYLSRLAVTRDLLDTAAHGDGESLDAQDCCMYAHALIDMECRHLEKALVDLGVLAKDDHYFGTE